MSELKKQKVFFLDRDGTICEDKGAFEKPFDDYEEVMKSTKLINGVKESLVKLKEKGYLIILISNQAGVAKKKMIEAQVQRFNKNINEELDNLIDGFYYCIHHTDGKEKDGSFSKRGIISELICKCNCRKPNIGLFMMAENDLKNGFIQYIDEDIIKNNLTYKLDRENIFKKKVEKVIVDKEHSYMIGDKYIDYKAGKNYGVNSALVLTGEGKVEFEKWKNEYDNVYDNINTAIEKILEEEKNG